MQFEDTNNQNSSHIKQMTEFGIYTDKKQYFHNEHFDTNNLRSTPDIQAYLEVMGRKKYTKNRFHSLLSGTQDKLFNQISMLMRSINQLKEQIRKQKYFSSQFSRELLNIKDKKNNAPIPNQEIQLLVKKYSDKRINKNQIQASQIQKIEQQNSRIERNIQRLQLRKDGMLRQILQRQNKRNAELKILTSSLVQSDLSDLTVMGKLQYLQNQIKTIKQIGGNNNNASINLEYANQEAKNLKKRILALSLAQKKEEGQDERLKLQQYLQEEAENKVLFLQDFEDFRNQYQQLKKENIRLRNQLGYEK